MDNNANIRQRFIQDEVVNLDKSIVPIVPDCVPPKGWVQITGRDCEKCGTKMQPYYDEKQSSINRFCPGCGNASLFIAVSVAQDVFTDTFTAEPVGRFAGPAQQTDEEMPMSQSDRAANEFADAVKAATPAAVLNSNARISRNAQREKAKDQAIDAFSKIPYFGGLRRNKIVPNEVNFMKAGYKGKTLLWLSGDTYSNRDRIKNVGFVWFGGQRQFWALQCGTSSRPDDIFNNLAVRLPAQVLLVKNFNAESMLKSGSTEPKQGIPLVENEALLKDGADPLFALKA